MSATQAEVEVFFKDNEEAIFKVIHSRNRKPVTHSKLVKRYTDIKGNDYYAFPADMGLPIERLGEFQRYWQYIEIGCSPVELKKLHDALAKIMLSDMNELEKKKRAGAIFTEIDKRERMSIHTELYYNLLAVQWIRQDELPEFFDGDIQLEKVEQFKEEVKIGGSYFFFQVPEFKKLNDSLRLSQSEWNALWQESLTQQTILPDLLNLYTSLIELKNIKRTSKNS